MRRPLVVVGDALLDRAVRSGYVEVSEALGNTPPVCKASYVDPQVVDLPSCGSTRADAASG